LATLAHELRNPLAPLRNAVQILRAQGQTTPDTRWAMDVIERQTGQMSRLVDDLLDVSRITRNKLELRRHRVDLAAVVAVAVETSRPLIDAAGHELTVTLPDQPLTLDADLTRLAQALSNLLNNAAKYTDRGGRIWLAAEREGSDAVVTVRDTGMGISTEMLPRVFEMFTQVDRSLDHAQGGLGIGLTLVKRLIEMHGGSVEARSGGPGKGSQFIVRLPVVVDVQTPARRRKARGGLGSSRTGGAVAGLRILVADDNPDSAKSLGMLLKLAGNDTRTAFDGLEAVGVADEFRPDVILLDIGMPRMNGYDAARHIRGQSWGERAVLIALTGWGQDGDKLRSREAGFDHHLVKPLETAALMRLLESLKGATAGRQAR
jgi:CheY-like chemotaxis protein